MPLFVIWLCQIRLNCKFAIEFGDLHVGCDAVYTDFRVVFFWYLCECRSSWSWKWLRHLAGDHALEYEGQVYARIVINCMHAYNCRIEESQTRVYEIDRPKENWNERLFNWILEFNYIIVELERFFRAPATNEHRRFIPKDRANLFSCVPEHRCAKYVAWMQLHASTAQLCTDPAYHTHKQNVRTDVHIVCSPQTHSYNANKCSSRSHIMLATSEQKKHRWDAVRRAHRQPANIRKQNYRFGFCWIKKTLAQSECEDVYMLMLFAMFADIISYDEENNAHIWTE